MFTLVIALACVQLVIAAHLPETCGKPAIEPSILHHRSVRIVGGEASKPYSWPWQVQIMLGKMHHCGATIIANDWLVTAAHCTKGYITPQFLFRAGRYSKFGTDEAYQQLSKAVHVINHENFDPNTMDNDIALVRLSNSFEVTDQVSPVCLPAQGSDSPPTGTHLYVTGWGDVFGTSDGDVLKQAMVPVVDREVCNRPESHDGWVTENMMCAGYEQGGIDACQGDSGGPLVQQTESGWQLAGVVSWGYDLCGAPSKPGVYVDVSKYVDWIMDKINRYD